MHLVIEEVGSNRVSFFSWFKLFFEGRLLNKLAPQLGNAYRGFQLKTERTVSISEYTASYLFFSWFDTSFNLLAVIIITLTLGSHIASSNLIIYASASALILVLIAPSLISWTNIIIGRTFPIKAISRYNELYQRIKNLLRPTLNAPLITKLSILGILAGALMALRLFLGFQIFGINLGITDTAILYTLFKLSTTIVITPGNIGVQELSLGLISEVLGYGMEMGIAVTIILRVYDYFLFLIIWLALFASRHKLKLHSYHKKSQSKYK